MLTPDEGYYFGMGAFETIAVEDGKIIFLQKHYGRLRKAAEFLSISLKKKEIEDEMQKVMTAKDMQSGRKVIKITISEQNLTVTTRENIYTDSMYEKGFTTDFSAVMRNETSPFTYHKTLNYGDSMREKRLAKNRGINEPIFVNTKGMITEGACTNVFFVREGRLYTPSVNCGLLPGIMRAYICERYDVIEQEIYPADIPCYDEMFVTNSLLGIMPVVALEGYEFLSQDMGRKLLAEYRRFCREN